MSRLTIPGFHGALNAERCSTIRLFTLMAKESAVINFASINSLASAEVSEKVLRAINGSNATLIPGVEILLLASEAKNKTIQTSRGPVVTPHLPFINLTDPNGLEWLPISELKEKMGYEKCPAGGNYSESKDGNWMILKPEPDEKGEIPAFVSGGFPRLLRGALEAVEKKAGRSSTVVKTARVVRPIYIKCTSVKWLFSGELLSKEEYRTKKTYDLTFHPSVRMWSGEARFVKPDEIKDLVTRYNENVWEEENEVDISDKDVKPLFGL